MLRMMYLGHPEAWLGDNVCENSTTPLKFVMDFKEEMATIAKNVWATQPDIVAIVGKKRKITETQKL